MTNMRQDGPREGRNHRAAYAAGGWATNMGNSYYNLGAMHALRRVFGESSVFMVPDLATWIWPTAKGNFEPLFHLDVDILFLSGPTLAHGIARRYARLFDSLTARGVQLGFVSVGAAAYTADERDEVLAFLNRYAKSVRCMATRDSDTYELYRGRVAFPLYDGVCCSMFLNEVQRLPSFIAPPYVVYNFAREFEPHISLLADGSVRVEQRTDARRPSSLMTRVERALPRRLRRAASRALRVLGAPRTKQEDTGYQEHMGEFQVVRTRSESFLRDSEVVFDRPQLFFGDLPEGFLSVYKNASYVFSDRVHTCAATLVLGGRAMYIPGSIRSHDNRRALFRRIGVPDIYDRPVQLGHQFIESEKESLVQFLSQQAGAASALSSTDTR